MATITTNTYWDSGTARSAGETNAIGSGAVLTVRADTRIHAGAPASFTGSLGNPTFTDIGGELSIDATAVRWLQFSGGSGNTPTTIGTAITQGGVSGYYLGAWNTMGGPPLALNSALGATGWIKLREVTGGAYSTGGGALGGVTANCAAADVPGWLEVVFDAGVNLVVPRVGKIKTRGAWFDLGTTNGAVGQTFTIPTTSSASTNNFCPGVWVETAVGSNVYEFWTGLASAACGWVRTSLGYAEGFGDARSKFVKTFGSGQIIFGETATLSATYASLAAQAGTYADIAFGGGTYSWSANVVYINNNGVVHYLDVGQTVYLDFTSGGATADGNYVVTEVLDAFQFAVALAGSGSGGNVTIRPGVTVTFTAHGLNNGDQVYCDFTSGTGVDGTYTVYSVDSANAYKLAYPHAAALTGGNVSSLHTLTVTYTAHGHAVGQEVYCDFTTGGATDGRFVIKVVTANTFNINYPHTAAIASSNVTLRWTIGAVPVSGCKVRTPNIFVAECATGTRATNSVPNATIGSRPEFDTTTAGAIDLEYVYSLALRSTFLQAYSVRLRYSAFSEALEVMECATALDIDTVGVGAYSAVANRALQLTSNFAAGSVVANVTAFRATAASSVHATEIISCRNITLTNLRTGIAIYARSTSGYPINIIASQNIALVGTRLCNGPAFTQYSSDISYTTTDYCDHFIGHTNVTTPQSVFSITSGVDNVLIDGVTVGLAGTVADCHPYSSIALVTTSTHIRVRNVGTAGAPLSGGTWAINLVGLGTLSSSGGSNESVAYQRCFITAMRIGPLVLTNNSDKFVKYEHLYSLSPWAFSVKAVFTQPNAALSSYVRAVTTTGWPATGQTSVYGTHWTDGFYGYGGGTGTTGAIFLLMNEPTAETLPYVTTVAGVVKFNSSGGVEMRAIGAEAIWEMAYFAQGIYGFMNTAPVMSGGTIGNYTLTYQIDTGSGWNGSWKTLDAATLNGETVTPTIGVKLKIKIVTGTTNATAITFLRIRTLTNRANQAAVAYPLDTVPVTITVLNAATSVPIQDQRVYLTATGSGPQSNGTVLLNVTTDANGKATNAAFVYLGDQQFIGVARRGTTTPFFKSAPISGTITNTGLALTVFAVPDE